MMSPITLITTPLILIISLVAAFTLAPEVDPVLTLSISDIPIRRNWPMYCGRDAEPVTVWQAYRFLSHIQETSTGHFTGNIRYPSLDIKCLGDLPILTKSYFGASGDLLKIDADGQFSFSWPSSYNHPKNQFHVFSFSGVREVFVDNICSEEDQAVVDWYQSWVVNHKDWADVFVSPLEDPLNPKCIKITYFSHQVYLPNPDGLGCEGLIYDTTKLVPLHAHPMVYNTAEVLNNSMFELSTDEYFSKFRLLNLFKDCRNFGLIDMWHTFAATTVHPVNNLPPQDVIAACFFDVDKYNNFNPGPISDDLPNPLIPKILIFVVCTTTLAFCTYIGYGYLC